MLVTFEGVDGVGKTTQIIMLQEKLEKEGHKCCLFEMGEHSVLKDYILESKRPEHKFPAQLRELLYYFEGTLFSEHYRRSLSEAYDYVLCDRWLLTYFAYGMNNNLKLSQILKLTVGIERPDLCFYFDLDPEISAERIQKYRKFDWPEIGYSHAFDENEGENINQFLINQKKIIRNFTKMIPQCGYPVSVINAEEDKETIAEIIYKTINCKGEK